MERIDEAFERYLEHVSAELGRSERKRGLRNYCHGLMLPLQRKSLEPLAAAIDPYHVCASHQSLQNFVADSPWSDAGVLGRVQSWVLPKMGIEGDKPVFMIADDSGIPKAGRHSVGVARQYCGQLGKTASCQIAVSLSIATESASLPVKYRLYLPRDWTDDPCRCAVAGVPKEVTAATKPEISLAQIQEAKAAGLPGDVVVADAGYGDDTAYRDGITALGLSYVLGIKPGTTVWAPGTGPLPPKPWSGRGKRPTRLRRDAAHPPVTVKALAMSLPPSAYRQLAWREGANKELSSRFAQVRVRPAHRDYQRDEPRDEAWLLIEWPQGETEPTKYFLSTLPPATSPDELVMAAKMRWRIERDYQELKQEFGLNQFEGRNWRGFHHHATLCIAAYGFLVGERLDRGEEIKKNNIIGPPFALPDPFTPRGARSSAAPCARLDSDLALDYRRRARTMPGTVPVLRNDCPDGIPV